MAAQEEPSLEERLDARETPVKHGSERRWVAEDGGRGARPPTPLERHDALVDVDGPCSGAARVEDEAGLPLRRPFGGVRDPGPEGRLDGLDVDRGRARPGPAQTLEDPGETLHALA